MITSSEALNYAHFANIAYGNVANDSIENGYARVADTNALSLAGLTGFTAVTYYSETTHELIFGFGGTESPSDVNADIQLAITNNTIQQHYVGLFVNDVLEAFEANSNIQNPTSITYTGHSLGGYLSQHAEATVTTDIPTKAVVFNSTGYSATTTTADMVYVYGDPRYWDVEEFPIHNLDNRISDDIFYVLDDTNPAAYDGIFGAHFLGPLRDAITEGNPLVSETDLILVIATQLAEAETNGFTVPINNTNPVVTQILNTWSALPNEVLRLAREQGLSQQCFPATTPITLADGTAKPISDICIGDNVLSFDSDGKLVESIVDKLFRNTTSEFIKLSFDDGRDDLVATPRHRFLTETGDFMEIGHMVRLGGGNVRLVEKDGSIVSARGEVLVHNAETAELFEQVEFRHAA